MNSVLTGHLPHMLYRMHTPEVRIFKAWIGKVMSYLLLRQLLPHRVLSSVARYLGPVELGHGLGRAGLVRRGSCRRRC